MIGEPHRGSWDRAIVSILNFSTDLLKTQMGLLFENWVGQELLQRCLYAGRAYRLSFWRTAYGAEVDYVLYFLEEFVRAVGI